LQGRINILDYNIKMVLKEKSYGDMQWIFDLRYISVKGFYVHGNESSS
jgi:hypothetical protein